MASTLPGSRLCFHDIKSRLNIAQITITPESVIRSTKLQDVKATSPAPPSPSSAASLSRSVAEFIDFTPPWPRLRYADLFRKHVGIAIDDAAACRGGRAAGFHDAHEDASDVMAHPNTRRGDCARNRADGDLAIQREPVGGGIAFS